MQTVLRHRKTRSRQYFLAGVLCFVFILALASFACAYTDSKQDNALGDGQQHDGDKRQSSAIFSELVAAPSDDTRLTPERRRTEMYRTKEEVRRWKREEGWKRSDAARASRAESGNEPVLGYLTVGAGIVFFAIVFIRRFFRKR